MFDCTLDLTSLAVDSNSTSKVKVKVTIAHNISMLHGSVSSNDMIKYKAALNLLFLEVSNGYGNVQTSVYSADGTDEILKGLTKIGIKPTRIGKANLIIIENRIAELIKKANASNEFGAVACDHDGWYKIGGSYCFVCNNEFWFNGEILPAYHYESDRQGKENEYTCLEQKHGETDEYIATMNKLMHGRPKVQVVFANCFTGLIIQYLRLAGIKVDEMPCLLSLAGSSGTGKTSVSLGTVGTLFNLKNNATADTSEAKLSRILKADGVYPTVMDDMSTTNSMSPKAVAEAIQAVFAFGSGRTRDTVGRSDNSIDSPIIASTEIESCYAKKIALVKGETTGSKYRLIELEFDKNTLGDADTVNELRDLSEKFSGQAIEFIHNFVDVTFDDNSSKDALTADKLWNIYNQERDELAVLLKKTHVSKVEELIHPDQTLDENMYARYANRSATIMTAARVLKALFFDMRKEKHGEIELDLDDMRMTLVESAFRIENIVNGLPALEEYVTNLLELTLEHPEMFVQATSDNDNEAMASFDDEKHVGVVIDNSKVWLRNIRAERVFKGFSAEDIMRATSLQSDRSTTEALNMLADYGFLRRRGDSTGNTIKKTLGNKKDVYVIEINLAKAVNTLYPDGYEFEKD